MSFSKHTFNSKTQGPAGARSNGLGRTSACLAALNVRLLLCYVSNIHILYLRDTNMKFDSWKNKKLFMNLLYIENYILSHYNIENGHSAKTVRVKMILVIWWHA